MHQKNKLRTKYLNLRKKKYQEINNELFLPLFKLIKLRLKKNLFKIALYYPSNFELNVLKIFEFKGILAQETLLPAIEKNNLMKFFPWKKNEVLYINEFGIAEPFKSKEKIPDVMLIPTLAFDENKFRLGYGKGYYDRYLNKYLKKYKDILTVGVAFSFQKYHKLPINQKDVKLNFILTEKGIY